MRAAVEGDGAAREELARRLRCVPATLARLQRRSGAVLAREDLHDLAQEILLALWERLPHYTGAAPLEAWVDGFCTNMHRNAVRKQSRRAWLHRRVSPAGSNVEPEAEELLDHAVLHAGLANLAREEATAIRMKCFGGLTFAEIGARLGVSPSSVKTSYYRGIRHLARTLGPVLRPS